jgi:hypothetical protein
LHDALTMASRCGLACHGVHRKRERSLRGLRPHPSMDTSSRGVVLAFTERRHETNARARRLSRRTGRVLGIEAIPETARHDPMARPAIRRSSIPIRPTSTPSSAPSPEGQMRRAAHVQVHGHPNHRLP